MKTPEDWVAEIERVSIGFRLIESSFRSLLVGTVRSIVTEALVVTPHEEPPITLEKLWEIINKIEKSKYGYPGPEVMRGFITAVSCFVLWQQSCIKFLAQETGYEEGVKVGISVEKKRILTALDEWLKTHPGNSSSQSVSVRFGVDLARSMVVETEDKVGP